MSNVLIYSEQANLAKELVSAGREIGDVSALAVNDEALANELSAVAEVLAIDDAALALGDTAAMAQAVKQAAESIGANVVLLSSNRRGKELAGAWRTRWAQAASPT